MVLQLDIQRWVINRYTVLSARQNFTEISRRATLAKRTLQTGTYVPKKLIASRTRSPSS
jgi:hypothetical protein